MIRLVLFTCAFALLYLFADAQPAIGWSRTLGGSGNEYVADLVG